MRRGAEQATRPALPTRPLWTPSKRAPLCTGVRRYRKGLSDAGMWEVHMLAGFSIQLNCLNQTDPEWRFEIYFTMNSATEHNVEHLFYFKNLLVSKH